MSFDFYSILEICGFCFGIFGLVGLPMYMVGARKAHHKFRVKGYLRPPSGIRCFSFLARKQFEVFDDSQTRSCFAAARFCMIVMLLILATASLLVGSELLLTIVNRGP
jgi:hypothetical protein